jgi:pimeloyl-ACP methyl ester carboxylesterase
LFKRWLPNHFLCTAATLALLLQLHLGDGRFVNFVALSADRAAVCYAIIFARSVAQATDETVSTGEKVMDTSANIDARDVTPSGFKHRMVRVVDINLHAVVGGAGPPLVLIHGFPQTWFAWRRMMPLLAANYSVVAVDLRGAGHSDCPQGGYDKASLAADVHGLMGALGHERYAVCGHDIGAMVALALASTQRSAVTKLALLDTPLPGWSRWQSLFADPRLWHFSFHMKADLPERLIYGREYDYVSTFIFDRAFDQGAHGFADLDVFARAFAQPGRTRGGLEWYRAFPKDQINALAWKRELLTMPVLGLGGDQRWGEQIVPMLKEFAANVRGGSIVDCNHWLAEERPAETADALLKFLAG